MVWGYGKKGRVDPTISSDSSPHPLHLECFLEVDNVYWRFQYSIVKIWKVVLFIFKKKIIIKTTSKQYAKMGSLLFDPGTPHTKWLGIKCNANVPCGEVLIKGQAPILLLWPINFKEARAYSFISCMVLSEKYRLN